MAVTHTTKATPPSFLEFIDPDMADVERRLRAIGEDDFPWLDELLRYILATPGKRARPAVTLLAGHLFTFNSDVHISMAVAVELLHTASLVHDDSVDKAALRRGTATINARYGDQVALLLGDYLFASSAEMVCATNNVRVITLFSRTLRLLADGELREIQQAFDWTGGEDEYWARVERKTASLFTTAAVSGAVLGGATEDEIDAVTEYGMSLGTAFQVVDDILDLQGDAAEVGKPIGSDLRGGILTLPALLYLKDHPDLNDTGPFARLRDERAAMPESDLESCVDEAISLIRSSDAVDAAYAVANTLAARARTALGKINRPDNPAMQSLTDIIDFVVKRHS